MAIRGINHITLAVRDLDRSWAFWVDTLGGRPLMRSPRSAYLLAGELWRGAPSHKLRRNLDQTLLRLRRKLDAAGVRTDLVQPDGAGSLALLRLPGDTVDDRS